MKNDVQPTRVPRLCAYLLAALTLIVLPGGVKLAQAQWTTNGNDINSTNSGNVGVGTTSPSTKLHVASSNTTTQTVIAATDSAGNSGSGVSLWSGWSGGTPNFPAVTWSSGRDLRFGPVTNFASGSGFLEYLRITSGGNVGIGTTSPIRGLQVSGSNGTVGAEFILENTSMPANNRKFNLWGDSTAGSSGRFYFRLLNDAGTAPTKELMTFDNATGYIGIGTTSPRGTLEVAGGESLVIAGVSGSFGSGAVLSGSSGITFLSNNTYVNSAANQFKAVDASKTSAGLQFANKDVYFRSFSAASVPVHTELLFINGTSGNVGVGTITPGYKVDVQGGQLNTSGGLCIAGDCKTAWSQVGSQWSTSGSSIYYSSGNVGIGMTPSQPLAASGYASGGFGTTAQIIGTAPSGTLQNQVNITASANNWGLIIGQNNSGAGSTGYHCSNCAHIVNFNNAALVFGTNNTDRMRIDASGNVGIGTASPSNRVDIEGATRTGTHATGVPLYVTGNLGAFSAGIEFRHTNGTQGIGFGYNTIYAAGSATNQDLNLLPKGTGTVGIGTATPNSQYKLDVNGNTKVTGNFDATGTITGGTIEAKYQDVAEWVPSTQKLSAGTVVVLDENQSNHVMASTKSYDTRVAGVISPRPGITLGEGGEGKVLVATTGRVKVRADATGSPIKVGDLLVTGDREGVAIKSVPVDLGGTAIHRPGTIIGKALEPLKEGTGEILVLLSLQ